MTEIVPAGRHLERALEIVEALAQFPQDTMLADRAAASRGSGSRSRRAAARGARGHATLETAWAGASRFAGGEGRGGGGAGGLMAARDRGPDLHKSYGSVEAVRGVSFEVEPGEVFGLLGPNGAGKTTTVEILEGYR